MKRSSFLAAIAAAAAVAALGAAPAATAAWDGAAFMRDGPARDVGALVQVQQQKGRQGGGERAGPPDRGGRDFRPDRPDDRRERMSEDDRRSLHRDLDKAKSELYGRRFQK